MRFKLALLYVTLLGAGTAFAQDAAVSKDEFDQITASPFKATHMKKSGFAVEIHLKADGSAVASLGQNDVGTWRRNGDAAYCVRWNKHTLDDLCVNFVKRDGKLAATAPNGVVTWWVESSK